MAAPRNMTPEQRTQRARTAAKTRWEQHNPATQRRVQKIRALIETFPPLTQEQLEELRALLTPTEAGGR